MCARPRNLFIVPVCSPTGSRVQVALQIPSQLWGSYYRTIIAIPVRRNINPTPATQGGGLISWRRLDTAVPPAAPACVPPPHPPLLPVLMPSSRPLRLNRRSGSPSLRTVRARSVPEMSGITAFLPKGVIFERLVSDHAVKRQRCCHQISRDWTLCVFIGLSSDPCKLFCLAHPS